MIDRMQCGEVPKKNHITFYHDGKLTHEHCLTRHGFDGGFTIANRLHAPHVQTAWQAIKPLFLAPSEHVDDMLLRRHYRSQDLKQHATPFTSRVPLLFSADTVVSVAKPTGSDDFYFENGDGDDLIYVHSGTGTLRTMLGDLTFGPKDYVFIPRGLTHRFILDEGEHHWFIIEALNDLHIPKQFRNPIGQFKMDAPYNHRDFKRPDFKGPLDEGLRKVVVKRDHQFTEFTYPNSPLDVIGWDGTVWPWVFNILDFQPKTSNVHLPPTIHGTFAIGGGLICSFVPRKVDYHPEAIPCPYPHASVHCDEVIFYCEGNFTSRKGIDPGSVSFHPMGISHGPHPGAYEASIGHSDTTELAVMLDVFKPLKPTPFAKQYEHDGYHATFIP